MISPMPRTKLNIGDPCDNCRGRHLKCDDVYPSCGQCQRLDEPCIRNKNTLRFRNRSSAPFRKDQTWLTQSRNTKLQFVDQTPELESYYAQDSTPESVDATSGDNDASDLQKPISTTTLTKSPLGTLLDASPLNQDRFISLASSRRETIPFNPSHKRRKTAESANAAYTPFDQSPHYRDFPTSAASEFSPNPFVNDLVVTLPSGSESIPASKTRAAQAEHQRITDSAAAAIPSASSGLLTPEIWKKNFFWPNEWTTTQCACMMRHFVDCIAPWFDVSDPSRYFGLVVPQRARRCPPLLNAIFTASARHLARVPRYRNTAGVVEYHGIPLYDLTAETAIKYHNACIAYLIELSKDEEHVRDENLLAAAVILRYYEELDTSLTGKDFETSLRTFQVFVDAQAGAAFSPIGISNLTTALTPFHINTASQIHNMYDKSFQHASFRVALRQEITAAFMKQRAIRLPLESLTWLRSLNEADDAVWTDRLIVFCADVLQFCYGDAITVGESATDRWNTLQNFERSWEPCRPVSFSAIHYKEPDRARGEVFPQIWHLADCHVSGLQYLDLARILLVVYDPTVPKLGPGAAAAKRRIAAEVRKLVTRLCGMALSNRSSEPALLMAQMAIATCGEYFHDRDQQRGMLDLLIELETEHARPTASVVKELKQTWSSDS